jgi:hypothetical protein
VLDLYPAGPIHIELIRRFAVTPYACTLGMVRLVNRRQVAITVHCISIFFDVYLKGAPASELKRQPEYPEIEYVH